MESKQRKRISSYSPLQLKTTLSNKKTASLHWSSVNYYPRLTVFIGNVKNSDGTTNFNNIINIGTSTTNILSIMSDFKCLIRNKKNGKRHVYAFYSNQFTPDGKMLDQKTLKAKLIIGKEENGVNFISLVEHDKQEVKFNLMANHDYFKPLNELGEEIKDDGVKSDKYALSYISMLEHLLYKEFSEACLTSNTDSPEKENTETAITEMVDETNIDLDEIFG